MLTEPETTDRSLTLIREIPAPVARVWAAWTDPAILPRWWGPRGFSCTTKEIDLREGGLWRFDMVAPDGTVYPNRHRYRAHEPVSRIAYTLDDDGDAMEPVEVDVRFDPVSEGTRVTLHMTLASPQARAEAEDYGAVRYGYTTLDCLAEAVMGDRTLSLTRILDAAPERVWAAWTDPEALSAWSNPDGIRIVEAQADVRPGGSYRFAMIGTDSGQTFAAVGHYREVTPPTRLVLVYGWEDDTGAVSGEMELTVTLAPFGTGTCLTLVQSGLPSVESRDSHALGWSQSLDQLPAFLEHQ